MQFWRESMSNKRWHKLVCYVYRDGGYVHASNPLHEKLNEPLCNRLDQLRHENGWSMKEFALRMDVTPHMFSELMHGRVFPRFVHLLNLEAMTGIKADKWMDLCVDGFRFNLGGMIHHPKYFITYSLGHLNMVERYKP